jgi:hypothetical protein
VPYVAGVRDGQDGYDGAYAGAIRVALAPAERSLDEALATVTVEDLLHAAEADLVATSNDGSDFSI